MSNFRDFLFNRDPKSARALALAMIAVRMGERQLLVGDDAKLFALLTGQVGLTGRVSVIVGAQDAAAQVEAAAAEFGVLAEDVRRAVLPEIPVDAESFDVAVLDAGPSFLALSGADRDALARGVHRALRAGGRFVVVEGQPPRLMGLLRSRPAGLEAFRAAGGAARVLEAGGFRAVRVLADREGQRFTEGIKGVLAVGQSG